VTGIGTEETRSLLVTVLRRNLRTRDVDDELLMTSDLVDLGLDSVTAVNLLLDVEDTFNVKFDMSMVNEETFRTMNALCDAVEALRREESNGLPSED
jgi:acyl carrier protein